MADKTDWKEQKEELLNQMGTLVECAYKKGRNDEWNCERWVVTATVGGMHSSNTYFVALCDTIGEVNDVVEEMQEKHDAVCHYSKVEMNKSYGLSCPIGEIE